MRGESTRRGLFPHRRRNFGQHRLDLIHHALIFDPQHAHTQRLACAIGQRVAPVGPLPRRSSERSRGGGDSGVVTLANRFALGYSRENRAGSDVNL